MPNISETPQLKTNPSLIKKSPNSKGLKILVGILSVLVIILAGGIFWIERSIKLKKEVRLPEVFVVEGGWWNADWKYRKPIDITSSVDLTNYAIEIVLDTKSLISAGKMQANCADIRFVQAGTELNYLIERGRNTEQTIVWFMAKEIKNGGSKVYMYYGNDSVSHNQKSPFVFFHGFENQKLDTWNTKDSWTINKDYPAYSGEWSASAGGSASHLIKNLSEMSKAIVEMNVKLGEVNQYHYPLLSVGGHTSHGGDYVLAAKPDGKWGYWPGEWPYKDLPTSTSYAAGQWYKVMVKLDKAGGTYEVFINGSSKGKITDNGQFKKDNKVVKIDILNTDVNGTGNMRIDNVFVRQFAGFGKEPCGNGICTGGIKEEETASDQDEEDGELKIKVGFLGRNEDNWKEIVEVCIEETGKCQDVALNNNGVSGVLSFEGTTPDKTYTIKVKKPGYLTIAQSQVLSGTIDMGKMPAGDLNADNQINSLDWSTMKVNFDKDGQ